MATKTAPGPRRPTQRRAEVTLKRIVAAAEALLAEEGAAGTTVKAVMGRAGVGPGSFYARFASREALLEYVQLNAWAGVRQAWADLVSEGRWGRASGVALAGEIVRRMVRGHVRHEAALRASLLDALQHPADEPMVRLVESDEWVVGRLVALFEPHAAGADAVRVAVHQLLSGVRSLILFPDANPFPLDDTQEDLILQLTRALLATVGIDGAPATYRELLRASSALYRGSK